MSFTVLQRVTLHNKFYNIFAYATANSFMWSLVCSITIRPPIIGVLIAGRNGILVEFYYLEESNYRVIAMSLYIEMGGAFSKSYNLILSSYN